MLMRRGQEAFLFCALPMRFRLPRVGSEWFLLLVSCGRRKEVVKETFAHALSKKQGTHLLPRRRGNK